MLSILLREAERLMETVDSTHSFFTRDLLCRLRYVASWTLSQLLKKVHVSHGAGFKLKQATVCSMQDLSRLRRIWPIY